MDMFLMLLKPFYAKRRWYQKEFKELLFNVLCEEAQRTKSKSRIQIVRVERTYRAVVEEALAHQLLTKKEAKELRATLREDLFKFMNK